MSDSHLVVAVKVHEAMGGGVEIHNVEEMLGGFLIIKLWMLLFQCSVVI